MRRSPGLVGDGVLLLLDLGQLPLVDLEHLVLGDVVVAPAVGAGTGTGLGRKDRQLTADDGWSGGDRKLAGSGRLWALTAGCAIAAQVEG